MIKKRQALEFIQNRLSGGDTPEDLRRLYPIPIIARMLNFAVADAVMQNSDAAEAMAVPYVVTPSSDTNGYFLTLPKQPVSGVFSIYGITDSIQNEYNIQTQTLYKGLKGLLGTSKTAAIYYGSTVRFNKKPTGDVTVLMIANIYQMADDDIICIPKTGDSEFGEMDLFLLVINAMKNPQFQDDLNNNSIDAQSAR